MINLNLVDSSDKQHSLNLTNHQFVWLCSLLAASSLHPEISTMSVGNISVIRLASSEEDAHYRKQETDESIKELRIWTDK